LKFIEQKPQKLIEIAIFFELRIEILFKKFHPRTNLKTLLFSIICGCKTQLNLPLQPFGLQADLNGSSGCIADLKPKGPGYESQIRQGYICWWYMVPNEADAYIERQPLWI
jgi:hypothetical protein